MTALSRAQKDYEGKQPSCGSCLPPAGQPGGPASMQGPRRKHLETQAPSQKAQAWRLSLRSSISFGKKARHLQPGNRFSKQVTSKLLQPATLLSAGSWSADGLSRARLEFGDSEAGPETQAVGPTGV